MTVTRGRCSCCRLLLPLLCVSASFCILTRPASPRATRSRGRRSPTSPCRAPCPGGEPARASRRPDREAAVSTARLRQRAFTEHAGALWSASALLVREKALPEGELFVTSRAGTSHQANVRKHAMMVYLTRLVSSALVLRHISAMPLTLALKMIC